MVKLQNNAGNYLIAASQNKELLKLFQLKSKVNNIKLNPDDAYATISYIKILKNKSRNFYYESSFLLQQGRFLTVYKNISGIQIFNNNGQIRNIKL